jgi:hypothetical protein
MLPDPENTRENRIFKNTAREKQTRKTVTNFLEKYYMNLSVLTGVGVTIICGNKEDKYRNGKEDTMRPKMLH